jgi:dolichyl-diphosphooligosaccharide--protein glycosyltransferase
MSKSYETTSIKNSTLNNSERNKLWGSRVLLGFIILFAVFLRYENFSVWQKNKAAFQFQGEYQMANFDSYYYLKIAKDLQDGTYTNTQEKRQVPNGVKAPLIPPLISILAASISSITTIPVSTVAIFLPIFLASLLAPLIFLLCIRLHFNKVAALTAALFSIISLTYIIRTRIGVFDTDCLNVVFVLLNSYLFFCFAELKDKKRYLYLTLGILSTLLFYIWWDSAISVVVLSAIIPLFVAFIFFYQTKNRLNKYSILSLLFLITTYLISDQVIALFNLLLSKTNTVFPNNMSISELDAVSISDFILKTTGNSFIFLCMVIGLIALVWKLKLKVLFFIIPFLLPIAAFFAGNRFVLFAAPILGLGIGYFVQILFDYKKIIKPSFTYVIASIFVVIGIKSNYKKITHGYEKPAAYENKALLTALDKLTPDDTNIWTNWDLGYQIQYYLDRGSYADGGFGDGEIYYYTSFPLATENLAVAANFMRFYNKNGIEGMKVLYNQFSGVESTFKFLRKILALHPSKAEKWFIAKQQKGNLPKTSDLTTPKEWIHFIFPKESDDIYLFLHYKMTQTASWFKQGNSDLKTGKTIGLPLFLALNSLKQNGNQIKNSQINLDTNTGIANYYNQKRYFQSLSTFNGIETNSKSFSLPSEIKFQNRQKDSRFVFQWNKRNGFGAAMSKEMANTTFVKLYLLEEKSEHFEPVSLNSPQYQVWKVTGNAYDKK